MYTLLRLTLYLLNNMNYNTANRYRKLVYTFTDEGLLARHTFKPFTLRRRVVGLLSVVHNGGILGGGGADDGGQDLVAGVVLPGLSVVDVGVLQVGGGLLRSRRRGSRVVVAAGARRRRPRGFGLLRKRVGMITRTEY